ncbi:GrpB family protein [Lysobacter enzymogenes]|uniref:GrpB family protein n=1 Tax=Lysobacter enzymogenes TaxID=69 RepID=UPI00099DC055|nr:GrpB family protein [Lysobacter enzymogenes]UZW60096.1 GrpB family protein [Lysobacter enzymogenes]
MPPPIRVELVPHDPRWAQAARERALALAAAIGPTLVDVHHIGSTVIAGIRAKPVLDLMPVVRALDTLDARRGEVEALGYRWWGEYGLPGRRYCTLSDAAGERRLVQAHCYEAGSAEAERHLAFRDYLRAHAEVAAEYDAVKSRCLACHREDSHAYSDCKHEWIQRAQAQALRWRAGR